MAGKTLSDRVESLEKGAAELDKVLAVQTNRLDNLESNRVSENGLDQGSGMGYDRRS